MPTLMTAMPDARHADLAAYYERRAPEYDDIYREAEADPVRARELAAVAEIVAHHLAGRGVLELACGTGHWTEVAARTAAAIVATDLSPAMLAIARRRQLAAGRIRFAVADAYAVDSDDLNGDFDGGLAGFWLSHVPAARRDAFLAGLHRRLGSGAAVVFLDNNRIPGLGGELVRIPAEPDTYKRRRLADGSEHLVLKNYFTAGDLAALLGPVATDLAVDVGTFYWSARYRVR
jgi:ubiquinone/menaquinone biosynthesis C-methylase UbiE